jgi:hypothetical protein
MKSTVIDWILRGSPTPTPTPTNGKFNKRKVSVFMNNENRCFEKTIILLLLIETEFLVIIGSNYIDCPVPIWEIDFTIN